jgi:hypothetical protein
MPQWHALVKRRGAKYLSLTLEPMLSLAGGIHSGRSIKLIAINGTKQRKTETAPFNEIQFEFKKHSQSDHICPALLCTHLTRHSI